MTKTINQSTLVNKQLQQEQRDEVKTRLLDLVSYNDGNTITIEQTDFINIYNHNSNGGAFAVSTG
jgi:hypothetical protein